MIFEYYYSINDAIVSMAEIILVDLGWMSLAGWDIFIGIRGLTFGINFTTM